MVIEFDDIKSYTMEDGIRVANVYDFLTNRLIKNIKYLVLLYMKGKMENMNNELEKIYSEDERKTII